jgi:hypothetical protein
MLCDNENINPCKHQFFKDVAQIVKENEVSYLPQNHRRLREKILPLLGNHKTDTFALNEVQHTMKNAASVIKLPRLGNQNAVKHDDKTIIAWILILRKSGNNYTNALIIRKIQQMCELVGKTIPSTSWFEAYLAKQETKVLTADRWGSKGRKGNILRGYNPTQNALFAGDAWQMDGSRVNMVSWKGEDGKEHFLYVVVVRDIHSGSILGASFGEVEDRWMYINALKMAAIKTGYVPYELILDKFPGHNTDEFRHVEDRLKREGVKVTYTSRATGKAQIERWFGTLQTVFMMQSQYYYGEGIQSSRAYAHKSVEALKKTKQVAKANGWNFDKAVQETEMVLEAYNATPLSTYSRKHQNVAQSPMQLHDQSDKTNVTKLDIWKPLKLFGLCKTLAIRNNQLRTEIYKQEYLYRIEDAYTILHYKEVSMYYDVNDLREVVVMDKEGHKYLCTAKIQERAMIYGKDADWSILAKHKAHIKTIEAAKQTAFKEKTEAATDMGEVDILMAGYVPKHLSEAAETAYLNGTGEIMDVEVVETKAVTAKAKNGQVMYDSFDALNQM